jgi:hypothetical protein
MRVDDLSYKCPDVQLHANRNKFRIWRVYPGEVQAVVCVGGGDLSSASANVVYSEMS